MISPNDTLDINLVTHDPRDVVNESVENHFANQSPLTADYFGPSRQTPTAPSQAFGQQQTAERKELEHKNFERMELERKNLEAKEFEAKEFERKELERKTIQSKELERKELERKEVERKKELERIELEQKALEHKELERKELERKELDRQELERKKPEPVNTSTNASLRSLNESNASNIAPEFNLEHFRQKILSDNMLSEQLTTNPKVGVDKIVAFAIESGIDIWTAINSIGNYNLATRIKKSRNNTSSSKEVNEYLKGVRKNWSEIPVALIESSIGNTVGNIYQNESKRSSLRTLLNPARLFVNGKAMSEETMSISANICPAMFNNAPGILSDVKFEKATIEAVWQSIVSRQTSSFARFVMLLCIEKSNDASSIVKSTYKNSQSQFTHLDNMLRAVKEFKMYFGTDKTFTLFISAVNKALRYESFLPDNQHDNISSYIRNMIGEFSKDEQVSPILALVQYTEKSLDGLKSEYIPRLIDIITDDKILSKVSDFLTNTNIQLSEFKSKFRLMFGDDSKLLRDCFERRHQQRHPQAHHQVRPAAEVQGGRRRSSQLLHPADVREHPLSQHYRRRRQEVPAEQAEVERDDRGTHKRNESQGGQKSPDQQSAR